ncbi:MAG: hypothetical protein FJ261_12740 [Planctomycetes bacterium]|nr:hypothetical protein [Planctomycetota bacterium]
MTKKPIVLVVIALSASLIAADDYDRPPIRYSDSQPADSIASLSVRMNKQEVNLQHYGGQGYLPSLLEALGISRSSQILVFSKTSLQRQRINPRKPRALYFNDHVTIGFCQSGDVLEITAADRNLGTVFYTLDQEKFARPVFKRETERCLICHGASATQGFPGHMIRSVATDQTGELLLSRGSRRVDHATPLEERWGGWYVTGTVENHRHMGNMFFNSRFEADTPENGKTIALENVIKGSEYLEPGSDIVALMVLEHQLEAHNRLVRANYLTRMALAEQAEVNRLMGSPANYRSEGITRRIERACEPVVEYLLFSGEAKLSGRVTGTSDFAKAFESLGPFDSKRRTLRTFDLRTRMFQHPMSYVVYSELFDGLPSEARNRIYKRFWEILALKKEDGRYRHLSFEDRNAILEIMRETKNNLPEYWNKKPS